MTTQAALAAALLLVSGAASAVTVDAVNDTFEVSFTGDVATLDVPGLTASATFLVTEFDGATGHVVLQITLSNTSDSSVWESARVSAIGFDVDRTLASASASGLFSDAVLDGQFPNQFGPIDVCAIDDPNNCSGGGSGGVTLGQSGVLTLTLEFGGAITSLDLTNFGVRYQSLDSDALGLMDDSGTGNGTPLREPHWIGLLGLGGLALLGSPRRCA